MLTPLIPQELKVCEWRQPEAFSRSFELWDGYKLLATLEFPKMFGSLATCRTAEGVWTFKRVGFFSPKTTARTEGSPQDAALYEPNFGGTKGTLILTSGEQLRLHSSNFWATEWQLDDLSRQPLLRFHNKGVFKHGANVEVAIAGRERHDLALLIPFAWYILVLYMEDASSAAATAAIG